MTKSYTLCLIFMEMISGSISNRPVIKAGISVSYFTELVLGSFGN